MTTFAKIPRDFIDLLLSRLDLVQLVQSRVPWQKQSGSNFFACCPFHQEKSPSFSVNQAKQFYYCFGCGAHGNAIDFIIHYDKLSFPETIRYLAASVGMPVPVEQTEDVSLSLDAYRMLERASQYYYDLLKHTPHAIEYLKNRGISGQIAKEFQVGYASSSYHGVLDDLGKTERDKQLLLQTGLIIQRNTGGYYDRFRDRIMFPIVDHRGKVIGFGGRILQQGDPKYLNSPETSYFQKGKEVYGLYQASQHHRTLDCIVVVEGYMDVLALFQYGYTHAVATMGTAMTVHHLERLQRYTSKVYFCFDGDAAGRRAAERTLHHLFPLHRDELSVYFLFLPEGHDPDSYLRTYDRPAFDALLVEAKSVSEYFFELLTQQYDLNTFTQEARSQFVKAAMEKIMTLPAGIFQTLLKEETAKRARVELTQLPKMISTPATGVSRKEASTYVNPTQALNPTMKRVLSILVQNPDFIHDIPPDFPDVPLDGAELFSEFVNRIKQYHQDGGTFHEYWRDHPLQSLYFALAAIDYPFPSEGMKAELQGGIRRLRITAYEREVQKWMALASQQGLTDEIKQNLTHWINKKKKESTNFV